MSLNDAIRHFDLERYCEGKAATLVAAGEYLLFCPQCGKEKLTVNVKKAAWHCWTCDSGAQTGWGVGVQGRGGLVDLLLKFESWSIRQAAEYILANPRHRPLTIERVSGELVDIAIDELWVPPPIDPPFPSQSIAGILPYLQQRGITPHDVAMFGLFVCTGGRYADRLIFPVWEQNTFVYWQARAMWEASDVPGRHYIKSLNPPRDDVHAVSSDVLMNLDQAACYPRVAIVEGPVDCIKTGPSAVCTFGKKMSSRQIAKLIRAGVQAVDLMWDGPKPREPDGAMPEMRAVAPTLSGFFDVRIVRLPHGDPGERTREELDYLREYASEPFEIHSRLAYI